MLNVIIFAVLLLAVIVSVIGLGIKGIRQAVRKIRHKETSSAPIYFKKITILLISSFLLGIVFIWFTQVTASTPAIKDGNGKVIPGSIAELRKVELNGRKEWISIRGYDSNNPVLLFLAGGPGGTQMAAERYDLAELEKYFVVVNWDQPGSGKSYGAADLRSLTVDTYIEDGYALTMYLCKEFNQDKILLIGESWGSALGIFLADQYPELYHAVIGTGQMVAFLETEIMDYNKAIEIAEEKGDRDIISKLEANGLPPYYGKDVTWKSAVYLQYLSNYMTHNQQIHNSGYNTLRDIFAKEYGILDKINFARGVVNTYNQVYPQLYDIDLRKDYTELDVPVYFFLGRHDVNAPISLAEEYYEILKAPRKEIIWFEHSGHSPWINESDAFVQEVLKVSQNY